MVVGCSSSLVGDDREGTWIEAAAEAGGDTAGEGGARRDTAGPSEQPPELPGEVGPEPFDRSCPPTDQTAQDRKLQTYSTVSLRWRPAKSTGPWSEARLSPGAGSSWSVESAFAAGPQQLQVVAVKDGRSRRLSPPPNAARGLPAGLVLAPSEGDLVLVFPFTGSYRVVLDEAGERLTVIPRIPSSGPFLEFARFLAALAGTPGDAKRLTEGLVSSGNTSGKYPLRQRGETLFVAAHPGGPAPRVAGSFTGWATGPLLMTAVPGTDLYYLPVKVDPGVRHQYKLVSADGSRWWTDPMNGNIAWDAIPRAGVGEFNSVLLVVDKTDLESRLWRVRGFESKKLGNSRDLYVLLPAGYHGEQTRRYPVLYVNDGNESITRSHFDQIAGRTIAAGSCAPLILVFIPLANQKQRTAEYTFGDPGSLGEGYRDFVAQEVVPFVDRKWRTMTDPGSRGVAGASLGGLISYFIAHKWHSLFGRVAGQSSSFWWGQSALIYLYKSSPKRSGRYYMDSGYPKDNSDVTREMAAVMKTKGYTYKHIEKPGAVHDWADWARRFPGLLSYLWPPKGP